MCAKLDTVMLEAEGTAGASKETGHHCSSGADEKFVALQVRSQMDSSPTQELSLETLPQLCVMKGFSS